MPGKKLQNKAKLCVSSGTQLRCNRWLGCFKAFIENPWAKNAHELHILGKYCTLSIVEYITLHPLSFNILLENFGSIHLRSRNRENYDSSSWHMAAGR